MTIEIKFSLICSTPTCGRSFRHYPEQKRDVVFGRDFATLRHEAAAKGWRRFRPHSVASMGDYCPQCCIEISRERTARQANKKPMPRGHGRKGSNGVRRVGS